MKSKTNKLKYPSFQMPFEVKDFTESEDGAMRARIKGYASTPSVDRYDDSVEPQAFEKSIRKSYKNNPVILFQHKSDKAIGIATVMYIDHKGLYIEADIYDKEIAPKIREKILRGFSIGFIPKEVEFRDGDGKLLDPINDNIWASDVKRIIKEVDLVEISVVSVPANQETLFTAEKSIKNYFAKNYNVNSDNMPTQKNLLETKEEEVVETPEAPEAAPAAEETPEPETVETPNPESEEDVETPADEQDDAEEVVDETPADEKSGEEEDGETPVEVEETPDAEDVEEEKGTYEAHDKSMKDGASDDDEGDEDEEKSVKVDPAILTEKNFLELGMKIAKLQKELAELKAQPGKQPVAYSEHGMPSKKAVTPSAPGKAPQAKGFKEALKNNTL